jgi:predicted peptidase
MLFAMWLGLWLTPLTLAQSPVPAAAPAAPAPEVVPVTVLPPGVYDLTLARYDGPAIRYALSIPPGYSPAKPVPLILSLHFGGDPAGAGRSMLDILIGPALADLGAIIVAPDSMEGGWNTPQNERAVQALLAAVMNAYRVDSRRMLVTGFSMGGAGTWHWANKFPELFSAAIPLAGRPTGTPTN